MKKMIFLLATFGMLLSCSINRTAIPNHSKGCLTKLDSLSMLMEYIKFGVYSVHLDAFSIEKYKGLSALELAINDVPLEEEKQRVFEFEKFIKAFAESKDCFPILSKDQVLDKIGEPANITPKRFDTNKLTYEYFIDIGRNCPNCDEPIHRIFDGCSYIRFYFENNELKNITFYFDYL